jgi:hypothetical protein
VRFPFVKIFTIAFFIGYGLVALSAGLGHSSRENFNMWLFWPSLAVMVLSLLGLFITLIVWVIRGANRNLFGNSEENHNDKVAARRARAAKQSKPVKR